ncbi:hypothetical protein GDO78_013933 [Eleutherodactylus coqui]|uniref:Uncharacterized protein n=1 Tax=Eleutherodactylus coqui TaxID=57060 RepID=A0A8J6B717_ELECQ|nr:hypothetical protein GDO78_013933 [Eleutherodactylus coqui]
MRTIAPPLSAGLIVISLLLLSAWMALLSCILILNVSLPCLSSIVDCTACLKESMYLSKVRLRPGGGVQSDFFLAPSLSCVCVLERPVSSLS